nr:zinc ribbon domain-containing protein [uncultured Prevotella sp.]
MSLVNLKCPNCGANIQLDNNKSEGFCCYCGTKIKIEDTQKLTILGTVKVDSSDELANLYQIARRAKDSDNSINAQKYYDMILIKDPTSWEATFYVTYFQSMQCKIAEISSAAISIYNNEKPVLELIKNHVEKEKQHQAIEEIYLKLDKIAFMFFSAAINHYSNIPDSIRNKYVQEYCNNASASSDIMYVYGNTLETIFGAEYGDIAAMAWKNGIKIHASYIKFLKDKKTNIEIIDKITEKIHKYDPSYKRPEIDTTNACYIATAIYGSYDCPEVWTLRRFRDYSLKSTWYGRKFIKVYYVTSPKLLNGSTKIHGLETYGNYF